MKGIARADGQGAADYEAVILAFSHLSNAIVADRAPEESLQAAAETGAVLLQLDSGAVFLRNETDGSIELAATYQLDQPTRKSAVPAEAVVRQCIERDAPIIVANVAADKRKGLASLAKKGITSLVCVPLKVGERAVGALMGLSKTSRAFSVADIEVLSAIASQAAFAAWRSKLSDNILHEPDEKSALLPSDVELIELANRKIQELSIINKISEAVISILEPSQLLDLALEQCLYSVGANVGSIMLIDDTAKMLTIRAAKGLSPNVVNSASVEVGQGISGWVAQHGQPVLVHDARKDPRFSMNRYRDDITSAMSVPLKARGRVIGVLNVSTIEQGRRYGPREVEFLSTIANQVAMAIDNAKLYERLSRRSFELASLLQISEAITSTLDLSQVLSLLSTKFMAMSHVDACALLMYEPESGRFRCLEGRGLSVRDRKTAYVELCRSIATQSVDARTPIEAELVEASPYSSDVSSVEDFKSAVSVPLTTADRTVGAVALFSKTPKAFSQHELHTLSAIGGLAGVAIHNALIYQHKYDIARSLQFQLVPTVPLNADGLDIGHRFLPAREVGGDYYDVIKIKPGRVGIVIADVAGNSVPAAMYTSMGKHVLRAYAVQDNSPSGVISGLNRIACQETAPEVFISLFYGVFDAETRLFRYACGGHEAPLLRRPDGSFERLHAKGLLVGITPEIDYEEKTVALEPGSTLVLFTDGVVDSQAVRGKFCLEDMKNILSSAELKPAQEVADNIYTRLTEVAGNGTQDDVALVVLKVV